MIDLSEIPAILRRHLVWLIVCPIVFAVLALTYAVLKTPVYQTNAELLVQPDGVQIIGTDPTAPSRNQTLQAMDLDSQTFVILSAGVLNEVANNLKLDSDPSFYQPGLRNRLLSVFAGGLSGNSRSSADVRAATLEALREAVNVFRLGRSFVFSITVSHPDPELAASIANETARVYIEQNRSTRTEALARASTTLGKQAQQLRARVETAEAAVEAYKARQGLISTSGGSVIDQQLDALNTQITDARVQLERAKSLYDQMAPLTLSDVEAGAVPGGTENTVLSSLRVQYAQVAQQVAEAATTLGSNHPTLLELRSQLSNTQREIQSELQRIKQSVRSQFEQAQSTVNALEQQSKNLQSQNTVQGKALIELRQLQSEAGASRAVYEAFLKRSRELEELPELDTSTTRILSEAPVPTSASGPKKILVLGAALVFGFAVAASGAVLLTLLKGPMMSERQLVTQTSAPILANLNKPAQESASLIRLPHLAGTGRTQLESKAAIARVRVAYALRNAIAYNRPANILALSVGRTGDTSEFVRSVAEELHDMGEEILFAHTTNNREEGTKTPGKPQPATPGIDAIQSIAAKLSSSRGTVPRSAGAADAAGLAGYLRVEHIDPRKKYASGGDLGSANEDILLVDAGNIDESPMLPVLLRHCDGIILITAVGDTNETEFEHAAAFLEPWYDRIIGNVVLSAA
ncbi:GumC family protein [Labrenzia sp. DG1229]|uniref:GumC family protein n=1 Tax=Labrenzia sp. DG1229 TaxID=681847 RepID=UPI00048AE6C1|nr:GumC family protein [Labrenzia sp. DG1229]